jgi:type II secretion system protein G
MSAQIRPSRLTPKKPCRWKNSKGFTLLELLVVVAIIGVLAAIAIPAYHNYVDKAQRTVAISTLDTIRKDLELYHIDYQEYPPEHADIATSFFFSPGTDSSDPPRSVFKNFMTTQISKDITPVSYTHDPGTSTYTFTATAKDKNQTLMTLTPSDIY